MNDGIEGRAAGRCGMGAVMGSKLLKAIAVHGSQKVPLFDEAGLAAVTKNNSASMVKKADWTKYGTSSGVVGSEAVGNLPIKNWSLGNFAGAATINGHYMAETILTKRYYCEKCVLGCGRTVEVKEGRFKTIEGGGPEYETVGLIGSNCMIDDLKPIALANELCNRYGWRILNHIIQPTFYGGRVKKFLFERFALWQNTFASEKLNIKLLKLFLRYGIYVLFTITHIRIITGLRKQNLGTAQWYALESIN
jgi:hypothetical protein